MKALQFTLAVLLTASLFSACKKDSPKAGGDNPPSSVYYFQGSINGTTVDWEASTTGNGWVVGSGASLSNNEGEISGGITADLTEFPAAKPQLGIEFKTFDKSANGDPEAIFDAFVTTGAWTYASTLDYTVGNKSIVVYYTDSNGNQYSSIGSQSGSSANVVTVTPVSGDAYNSDPGLKIKLTFNCTLYPVSGTGSSIAITNGQATVFLDNMLIQ